MVDPNTFALGSYSTIDAVGKLGADGAIAVGRVPTGQLSLAGFAPLHTIASVPAFPGIPRSGGYVVSRKALTNIYAPSSWLVWSGADVATVTNALAAAGIERIHVRTAATSLNASPFFTMEWTFGYIASVGALLAVVAAASLLLAVGARRRQTVLSGALAVRMGLTARTFRGVFTGRGGTRGGDRRMAGRAGRSHGQGRRTHSIQLIYATV